MFFLYTSLELYLQAKYTPPLLRFVTSFVTIFVKFVISFHKCGIKKSIINIDYGYRMLGFLRELRLNNTYISHSSPLGGGGGQNPLVDRVLGF